MREWKPEKQFKKADFPAKKKDSEKRPVSAEESGRPAAGPSSPEAKSSTNPEPPLKGWSVPRLEGGHIIAGGAGSKPTGKMEGESKKNGSVASGRTGSGPSSPAPAPEGKDMTRVYLSQLVGQDPRGSTDILRSWYWEKPGRESPVKYVPPKNRIHLILRSLNRESLLALYEMMTPVERRQMEELRKEPMHVNDREILKVRQYFMARLTGQV